MCLTLFENADYKYFLLSSPSRPKYRIPYQRSIIIILKQLREMAHCNVYVAGFNMGVCPNYGVVAHFFIFWRVKGRFINAGQYMDSWPGAFVVQIPFILCNKR